MNLLKSLQTITFHRAFVEIGGSINAALLLSNALYWTNRLPPDRAGWFYKTRVEWEKETGLSRHEQDKARQQLMARGLLEARRARINAADSVTALWFRVDLDALARALEGGAEPDQLPETGTCQMPVCATPIAGNRQSAPYYSSTTHLNNHHHHAAPDFFSGNPVEMPAIPPSSARQTPNPKASANPNPLSSDWQPNDLTFELLAREGMDRAFVTELVGEFVLYWLARNEPRPVWDAVFVRHARREFAYRQQNPEPSHGRSRASKGLPERPASRRRETIGERLERYERFINAAEPAAESAQDAIAGDFIRH